VLVVAAVAACPAPGAAADPRPSATLFLTIESRDLITAELQVRDLPPDRESSLQLPFGIGFSDSGVPAGVRVEAIPAGQAAEQAPQTRLLIGPDPPHARGDRSISFRAVPRRFRQTGSTWIADTQPGVTKGSPPDPPTLVFEFPRPDPAEILLERVEVRGSEDIKLLVTNPFSTVLPPDKAPPQIRVPFTVRVTVDPAGLRMVWVVGWVILLTAVPILVFFSTQSSWTTAWRPRVVLGWWLIGEELSILCSPRGWEDEYLKLIASLGATTPLVIAWGLFRAAAVPRAPEPLPAADLSTLEITALRDREGALQRNLHLLQATLDHYGGEVLAPIPDRTNFANTKEELARVRLRLQAAGK
jgi:hypothetical protein